ncbi:MAG: three-Cys-motif partner protein TcmP [Devosia sp.]
MGKLVGGDDGLPAEEVGDWIADKHELLCDYVQISSATRRKYLSPIGKGGAAFIDLFCGPGRVQLKGSGAFVDGGCVAAWKKSVAGGAPFSKVIIGDVDEDRLKAAGSRLSSLGAPVHALLGPASATADNAVANAADYGLNFVYLDPYSLGALDFTIIAKLSKLRRIDILVHVSQMDLQRNFDRNAVARGSALDTFAPEWRDSVDPMQAPKAARQAYFQYWRGIVAKLGVDTNTDMRLITGPDNQPLYLLLLAARHELAHTFWQAVAKKDDPQGALNF